MASDIILDDNLITLSGAERVVAEQDGRVVEIDLRPNAMITIGTDEHRGMLRLSGHNARIFVSDGAVQARNLVARDQVRIGRRGEGGIAPGRLSVQGSGRDMLMDVDGDQGTVTVDGFGDLRDRLAELAALRGTVAQLEARIQALESQ